MSYLNITFDKSKTAIIKGFAIVFMIIHHIGWTGDCMGITLSETASRILGTFKLCVPIFVFMIGYGYSFSKEKDFAYSFRHIKKLLLPYWTILFLFALPVCLQSIGGGKVLLLNMIGVDETILWVSWFVYLYIWAMVIMPFIGRLIDRKPLPWSLALVTFFVIALVAYRYLVPQYAENPWTEALLVCLLNTPLIIIGYYFGRTHLFEKIRISSRWYIKLLAVLGIILSLAMRLPSLGTIPSLALGLIESVIFILCVLILFQPSQSKTHSFISKVFSELGDKSVYMWFIHPLFFVTATTSVYGRIALISGNLWIVCIWTILLSYMVAGIVKKVVEY